MATLMDTIKKNLTGQPAQSTMPQLGQTQRAQSLMEGLSGKQVEGEAGPARSTIQEKSALQQTQAGLQDQSLQNKLQAQELEQQDIEQTAKVNEQKLNLADQLEDYRSAFERQTDNLLGDFERDKRQLEDSRAASKLEQTGFLLRLQDQDYLANLKRVGDMNRLNDSLSFKEAATRSALEDEMGMFKNDLAFKTFMNADDRQFQEQLANMDINFAMDLAGKQLQAQQNQMIFSGLGTAMSGGIQAWVNSSKPAAPQAAPAPAPPAAKP